MEKFEEFLMKDILWNFEEEQFLSQKTFLDALTAYNQDITSEEFTIDLEAVVLKSPKVVIQYSYHSEEEDDTIEPSFLLGANNGIAFTKGELLYNVHNRVCKRLKDEDHKYFEGFSLWSGINHNYPGVPLYFLQQGS